MITIMVDTSEIDKMLVDISDALAKAQRVALHQIGNSVMKYTREAFKNPNLRPSPWEPRKDKARHPLLLRSTTMWRSIVYRVTAPDTVEVGTSAKYAPYHQFGTKHIPARPFFPIDKYGNLTPDAQKLITHKVQSAYAKALEKLGEVTWM